MRKVLYILGQLADEDVAWIARHGRRREVPANHELIHEGVGVAELFIVLQGSARVIVSGGHEIARLGSGEVLGEMSLVDRRPPSATVQTAEPTMLLALDRSVLEQKLNTDMAFAARFYRALAVFLSDRMRNTVAQLGYGEGARARTLATEEELDESVLDNVHLAGIRFDSIIKTLMQERAG